MLLYNSSSRSLYSITVTVPVSKNPNTSKNILLTNFQIPGGKLLNLFWFSSYLILQSVYKLVVIKQILAFSIILSKWRLLQLAYWYGLQNFLSSFILLQSFISIAHTNFKLGKEDSWLTLPEAKVEKSAVLISEYLNT